MIFDKIKKNRYIVFFKLLRTAFSEYKFKIIFLVIIGFFASFFEAIGINAIIPLFSILLKQGGEAGGDDFISNLIREAFYFFDIDFRLKYILILILILFLLRNAFLFFANYFKVKISREYEEDYRNKLLSGTFQARWGFLLKQKLGELDALLLNNTHYNSVLFEHLNQLLVVFIGLIVYLFVAINISFPITMITLLVGGIIFFILKPLMFKIKALSREVEKSYRKISHFTNENIVGMKTLKAMFVGDPVKERGRELFAEYKSKSLKIAVFRILINSLMQPLGLLFILSLLAYYYGQPGFNIVSFGVVLYIIQRIFLNFQQIQAHLTFIGEAAPYLIKVLDYEKKLSIFREVDEGNSEFAFKDLIKFDNVSFSYDGKKEILSNLNLEIKKGEAVGIIGKTGSGKTTIVDLFLRLFEPTKGEIRIDEKNINKIEVKDWRKNIGYISQDIFLKNDTIANNIRFYNKDLSDESLVAVAKKANIFDFIDNCEDKFETIVGERGVMLSVGQRQRISIARILAREPEILILDEATSSLDNDSERQIKNVIKKLKGEVTVVIVAHRLSTVLDCDKLVVLDNGEIVEKGSPFELLKDKKSYFYKIYNMK